ncbi:RrF2 family transcriptional regulator [Propionicimonas sp.]|uniref:RrF2 family transcriptional regulator n=1 Tax=Propionicimonas sp. TaxID=1955623 RepID=UPI0039E29545
MQVTARVEYALRAVAELAADPGRSFSRNELATAQDLPGKFLESILRDLVREGVLVSRRGAGGGFQLAVPASELTLAEVVRAVDGPLAAVRGVAPEGATYEGAAAALTEIWVAVRAAVRMILEGTTVADLVSGELPGHVRELISSEEAWHRR